MAWNELPLTGDPYQNVEEVELDGVSPTIIDGYVNELGHTVKRPGLSLWSLLSTDLGVDGLYWWDQQNVLLSVSGGYIKKHTAATGYQVDVTGDILNSGTRVTFATDRTKTVMANGGRMVHTDGTTATLMADADAPTAVSHVAYLDGYILANQVGQRDVNFSDPLDLTAWTATDTFRKAGRPDNLIAMHEGWSELLLVGKESVEVWYNDGVTPFVRRANGMIARGCAAPYTVQQVGNNWVWLDNKRRFVKLNGRTPEHISFPYHKMIQSFSVVDNALSDNMEVAGFPLYVTSFPGAKTTLTYNYQTNGWSQWGYWNTDQGVYECFRGQCYAYSPLWNLHLVGDRNNGKIYTMSKSVYTDDGNPIRTVRRTGFVSHGTYTEKKSKEIVFRLKRGQGNSAVANPVMTLKWRNHNGAWSNEHVLSIGAAGDHYLEARIRKLGSYKFRQYEIAHSDPTDFVLVDAQEDIE